MDDCIFCKVVRGELPSKKVYEDDLCLVFHDIAPLAPTHLLVVPKNHFDNLTHLQKKDDALLLDIFSAIKKVVLELNISDNYRLVTNNGKKAGQQVGHLHFHILGGWE